MKIVIEIHYLKGDLHGDYTDVVVKVDGSVEQEYGDQYNDKGKEKAAGFVDGLRYAWDRWGSCERFEVEKTHIADREK